jgi:two-component system, chemotaxis family, sensor kinase CheA
MSEDLSEYKDLYLQTSREYLQSLNENLLKLEKDQTDPAAIDEIFRSAHSLKSQSAAMGYEKTGYLCHTVEDVFYEIKEGRLAPTAELADSLFKAFDNLTKSIDSIEQNGQEVDLTESAEELKQQTGVTTSGAGKSQHNDTAEAAPVPAVSMQPEPPAPAAPAEPQTIALKIKTITLPVDQLDTMMNLIEDLTVHSLRMRTFVKEAQHAELREQYDRTAKIIQNLQYEVMKARLIPVSVVFDHFPRAVRDVARIEQKEVTLKIEDDGLAIDRAIVEHLDEPLIHLLRNAVSHGIEQTGTITISTEKQGEWAVIHVHDDGQGINWEKLKRLHSQAGLDPNVPLQDLVFAGISTAETVTSISGRGVGMKVVRETVEGLGGQITVESLSGQGTTFTLRFPLSLAISKALLVGVGAALYAVPANAIKRIVTVPVDSLKMSADQQVFVLDKMEVPLVYLERVLGRPAENEIPQAKALTAVIVGMDAARTGLVVDIMADVVDIIMKPLPEALRGSKFFVGTTILENGQTCLVINPQTIARGLKQ